MLERLVRLYDRLEYPFRGALESTCILLDGEFPWQYSEEVLCDG